MYIIGGTCEYCKTYCSRSGEDRDKGSPILITPNLPFVREIICQPCWVKLKSKLTSLVDSFMAGESKQCAPTPLKGSY